MHFGFHHLMCVNFGCIIFLEFLQNITDGLGAGRIVIFIAGEHSLKSLFVKVLVQIFCIKFIC